LHLNVTHCPGADKLSLVHKMSMALDFRLNALKLAILEDWAELEADEADGALVIRVRDRGKTSEARKE